MKIAAFFFLAVSFPSLAHASIIAPSDPFPEIEPAAGALQPYVAKARLLTIHLEDRSKIEAPVSAGCSPSAWSFYFIPEGVFDGTHAEVLFYETKLWGGKCEKHYEYNLSNVRNRFAGFSNEGLTLQPQVTFAQVLELLEKEGMTEVKSFYFEKPMFREDRADYSIYHVSGVDSKGQLMRRRVNSYSGKVETPEY